MQVTQVSLKPVLTYESFHLYNEFVNNSIAVGSYHLEGKTLRILFGECSAGGLDCSGDFVAPGFDSLPCSAEDMLSAGARLSGSVMGVAAIELSAAGQLCCPWHAASWPLAAGPLSPRHWLEEPFLTHKPHLHYSA